MRIDEFVERTARQCIEGYRKSGAGRGTEPGKIEIDMAVAPSSDGPFVVRREDERVHDRSHRRAISRIKITIPVSL